MNEVEIVVRAVEKGVDEVFDGTRTQVKGLGREVEDLGGKQRKARGDADGYGKGLAGLGEKADASEARIIGVKDTIDGAAAVMRGPGADGIGAYLQGWADLASGLASAVIPALSSLSLTNIRTAASTVASTVAQKTAAAATKAWAAAQWVMNAALTANPIGLVVVAIAALVAGVILAYKHSETFRKIVQAAGRAAVAAFHGVLSAVGKLVGWIRANFPKLLAILAGPFGLAVRAIVKHRDGILSAFRALPGRIGSALSGVYEKVTAPFRNAVGAIGSWLDGIRDRLSRIVGQARGALSWLPGLATGGISGAAGGGPRGRTTWVGEHGPELVDLPFGSMVHSNPDSMRMLAGAGGGSSAPIVIQLRFGDRDLGEILVDPLRKVVRAYGGSVQAVLGTGDGR